MPNRWIKEAYCTSPRIGAVGPEARDLWVRLLVNADDHGYFHGGADLVASLCFPLKPNARKCEQLLAELADADLIVRYDSSGKHYLAITQWYERPRSQPKFPPPPVISAQSQASANSCEQVPAVASLHVHDHDHDHSTTTETPTAPSDKISLDAEHGWGGVTEQDRETWKAAFPAINIDAELAKAQAWAKANPTKRKSNWRRFLVGWFSRSQDKGPPTRSNGKAPTLAEKRAANMDEITGRAKHGRTIDDAGAVDRAPVRPALGDLREPDDGHVGRLPKG